MESYTFHIYISYVSLILYSPNMVIVSTYIRQKKFQDTRIYFTRLILISARSQYFPKNSLNSLNACNILKHPAHHSEVTNLPLCYQMTSCFMFWSDEWDDSLLYLSVACLECRKDHADPFLTYLLFFSVLCIIFVFYLCARSVCMHSGT